MMPTSFTTGESPLRATKLNTALSERVLRTGDTMTGPLVLQGTPILPQEAATKQYVDSRPSGGGGSGGYVIGEMIQGPSPSILTDLGHGVLIPGYVYPGNPYTDPTFMNLLAIMRKYYDVPVIYVINPGNGPGAVWDGNYAAAIKKLQGAGAAIVGYVSTAYTARDPALVRADVDTWISMYADTPINGIFFDEMTWELGVGEANVALYQGYCTYVHDRGLPIVIGNPGTNQQGKWYLADPPSADIIVTWETFTYPTLGDLHTNFTPDGHVDYSWKRQSVMVHSQSLQPDKIRLMKQYVKWLWVTDDTFDPVDQLPPDDNPYDEWPTYLEAMFAVCRNDPWATMMINTPLSLVIPNGTMYFTYDAPYAGLIMSCTRVVFGGTCNFTIQIDGVAVGNLNALAATSTPTTTDATMVTNSFLVGSKITCVVSAAAGGPVNAVVSLNMIKYGGI